MRSVLLLVVALFVFAAAPAMAKDNPRQAKAQLLARVLGAWLDSVGDTLSGDGNTVAPTSVDGSGNTVFNIDELVINIDVGDVAMNEEYGGAEEVANRLVDLLMQGMEKRGQMRGERSGVAMIPPPYCKWLSNNTATQPADSNSQWSSQYRQESRAMRDQEKADSAGEEHHRQYQEMRGHGDKLSKDAYLQPDRPHGRGYAWTHPEYMPPGEMPYPQHPRPEIMEMLMQIPPEVEPEFIEFMMEVGRLARDYPEFREHLEKLVEKAHEREAAEAGH